MADAKAIFVLCTLLLLSPWQPSPVPGYPGSIMLKNFHNHHTSGIHFSPSSCCSSKIASAQGLSVPEESLGAGELAAFDLFSRFEEVLELSDDFTGGRGGGGRGGTGGRRGAAFEDMQSLRQQQLELYHVAGSPQIYHSFNTSQTLGGNNYLPTLRDQGACSTCVAQAVAAAASASVASTLRVNAADWDISPQSFYYCSEGGKTCASGWQIAEALYELKNNPGIIRRSNCTSANLVEAEIGTWAGVCAAAASACPVDDVSLPWLSCSYKTLSSFWQIQQAIRQHGAVITRITIYDDFMLFFDAIKGGLDNGIYTPRLGARKLYGHAAIIVGYDNINKAWTLLNSWGTRSTKDGLFRIAMGQAGVGAPDESYAVSCEPKAGTDLDMFEAKPWKRNNRRPVRLVDQKADWLNLRAPCYYYDAVYGDTASAIADAFLLDIRMFVQDNTQVFKPFNVTASFNESLTEERITAMLNSIKAVQRYPEADEPYLQCTDTSGVIRECRIGGSIQSCVGATNCSLFYTEVDVSITPVNQVLHICNITSAPGQFEEVAYFQDPVISGPRALKRLLGEYGYDDVPIQEDYCKFSWTVPNFVTVRDTLSGTTQQVQFQCGTYLDPPKVIHRNISSVTFLPGTPPPKMPSLDSRLVGVISELKHLDFLQLAVGPGSFIPQQLGAIKHLRQIELISSCWKGELPANLGRGWPDLMHLIISQTVHVPRRDCGLQGTLPSQWGAWMPQLRQLSIPHSRLTGTLPLEHALMIKIMDFLLPGNYLTGALPSTYGNWSELQSLDLSNNLIQGQLPAAWSALRSSDGWKKTTLDLSNNNLQGEVPAVWLQLSERISELKLSNNPGLKGCIPMTIGTPIEYQGTRLTGLCTSRNKQRIEQQQADAMRSLLVPLLHINASDSLHPAAEQMASRFKGPISELWPAEAQDVVVLKESGPRGCPGTETTVSVTMRTIDTVVYITEIGIRWEPNINFTILPDLVAQLPHLESFICNVWRFAPERAQRLPPSLASKAPNSLTALTLSIGAVEGPLPEEWGDWSSLVKLDLSGCSLTGTLPASWKGMSSLKTLQLESNKLQGTLPPEWGHGDIAGIADLNLEGNPLHGTIPVAWIAFKAVINLGSTNVHGCIPDQLLTNVVWDQDLVPCSRNSSEVANLLQLRNKLDPSGLVLSSWIVTKSGPTEDAGPGVAPGYCNFRGVSCNQRNKVSTLHLSELTEKGLKVKVKVLLNEVLQICAKLQGLQVLKLSGNGAIFDSSGLQSSAFLRFRTLQHLDISGCGLSGPVPPGLAGAFMLQHLNLSRNPKLTGSLPEVWAGLTDLQVLDVSNCGLGGTLPDSWASMQQLRVFKASSNKPGVAGQLPDSWGMLSSLEVLEINQARLTGSLPAVWADPTAMAAKASSILQLAAPRRPVAGPMTTRPKHNDSQTQWLAKAANDAAHAAFTRASQSKLKLGMLRLQTLSLSGNLLFGNLPREYAAMTGLMHIFLDDNRLSGPLPAEWAALKQLQVLDLSHNRLASSLPFHWGALMELKELDLSDNPLSGSLPAPWSGLKSLRQLDVSLCRLTGKLPSTWFGLREVRRMNFSGNLLQGTLPAVWGMMGDGRGHKLQHVDLSNNVCMDRVVLQKSIVMSKIEARGRVTVNVGGTGATGGTSACDGK